MATSTRILVDDGIAVWFEGPHWDEVAAQAFEEAKDNIVAAAQTDAPWTDRTGDARRGLEAKVEYSNGDVVLTLYHTVEYGLWLEVIQNGRFATIMPTLERYAAQTFAQAEAKVATARQGVNY